MNNWCYLEPNNDLILNKHKKQAAYLSDNMFRVSRVSSRLQSRGLPCILGSVQLYCLLQ